MVAGLDIREFAGTGEVITIAPTAKNFVTVPGTHGSMIRARTPNEIYEGKVSILQGSPFNETISARIIEDAQTGAGVGRLMIKDLNGTSLVSASISFFDTPPGFKGGVEAGMNDYTFVAQIPPAGFFIGSNRFLVAA